MFARFTERARHAVVLAQDEARALRHDYVGAEHLLLGLLGEEEGLAARVLESIGVTLEETRDRVRAIVGEGDPGELLTGQIPFTPGAKQTLELALREALTLSHNYVGTEHILLGLVRAGDGVSHAILEEHGAGEERIREEVVRMLAGSGGAPIFPAAPARAARRRRRLPPVAMLVTGWLLFALALGLGVLVGWAIWG